MRVLVYLIDALPANRSSLYSNEIKTNNFDRLLNKIGGTFYSNVYTPAPDSPRSTSVLYSGLDPFVSKNSDRIDWPGLKFPDTKSIFQLLKNGGYKINCLVSETEIITGRFFPKQDLAFMDIKDISNTNLNTLFDSMNSDKEFLFIQNNDYHYEIDDRAAHKSSFKSGINRVSDHLNKILNLAGGEFFDYVFIISDHGSKLSDSISRDHLLDDDRINIFCFLHTKGDLSVSINNKLFSIKSVYQSIKAIIENKFDQLEDPDCIHLQSKITEEFICIEDYASYSSSAQMNHSLWAVKTKDYFFSYSLNGNYFIDKYNQSLTEHIIYDDAIFKLKLNSSNFQRFHEAESMFREWDKLICTNLTDFSNGDRRIPKMIKIKKIFFVFRRKLDKILLIFVIRLQYFLK
jgi:hypothetical protein